MLKKKFVHFAMTIILICSFLFPVAAELSMYSGKVFAEDEDAEEIFDTNQKEDVASAFSFTEKATTKRAGELFSLTFVSTKEVEEATIYLPKEVSIIKESLAEGMTVAESVEKNYWVIRSSKAQTRFTLPLVVEEEGTYEASIDDSKITINIKSPEEHKTKEEEKETNQEKAYDSKEEKENQAQEEQFDGELIEVTTFEEFRLAIADPKISQIEVRNNLTRSGTGIATAVGTLNRNLAINGNGFTINFGADNGSLNLGTLSDDSQAVLRVHNAIITKTGETPIFNASGTGLNWTLELEDITEGAINASRLAFLPEGQVVFTGGTNQFVRTSVTNVFLQAKQIEARGGAQVTISRGNSWVFFSNTTIAQPKLTLKEGANVSLTTASGTGVPIDLRGADAAIEISENASLHVQTQGTTAAATNTTNNGIAMTGSNPTLSITDGSNLQVNTTNAKRGIVLIGSTPSVVIENSTLSITSATAPALHVNGVDSHIYTKNSEVNIATTTGRGIDVFGSNAQVEFVQSKVDVSGQGTTRIFIEGNEGKLISENTEGTLSSTTGWGMYLTGGSNKIKLDNDSKWDVTSSGTSQNILILADNPQLHVTNGSSLTTSSAQGVTVNFLLQGANPELKIENNSHLNVTTSGTTAGVSNTENLAVSLNGENPSLSILENSEMKVNVLANNKRSINIDGVNPKVNVQDSTLEATGFTAQVVRMAGAEGQLTAQNADIYFKGTSGPVLNFTAGSSILSSNNSKINIESTSGNGVSMIGDDNTIRLADSSRVTINSTTGNNIAITGNNATLTVIEESQLSTTSGAVESIQLAGNNATLRVHDPGTKLTAKSNFTSDVNGQSTIRIGGLDQNVRSEKYLVEVGREAILSSTANISSAIQLSANDGEFVVFDKGQLLLENGATNGLGDNANATLRFSRTGTTETTGGHSFLIDNGSMGITKTGGNASTLRMFGSNNQVKVENKGKFFIKNRGSGSPSDGGSGSSNQGIDFRSGNNNRFAVTNPGSEVDIVAQNGPAVDMNGGTGFITATNGGYFEASGRTATAGAGIFNAGVLTVDFDNPLFLDFRNNRPGGGNIFNNTAASILEAKNSDLAVWRNGSNLDGDPDLNFPTLDYSFTGTNFNTLRTTSQPEILNTSTFGNTGLAAYSRMSSNNARWAIADELRVPTNADKKIHGHVSVPVGLEESRSAWEAEATVIVEVERGDGTKTDYTAKTVGHSNEEPGISIYGEEPRAGLFEVELEEHLQKGDKVKIKEVRLTSGELTQGYENINLTDTVEVFQIIPPTPAKFSSSIVSNDSRAIKGFTENKEATITATHNDEPINTENVVVDEDGTFTIDLSHLSLQEDDKIQVFLKDHEGSATAAGVTNPPITNDEQGNINPKSPLSFRDRLFDEATVLTVQDLRPVSPVDPLDPEVEVDPENKPDLPEDQGRLSLDFVSQFNFGKQGISVQDKTYHALPQRLLNEDGTVNETEERPNYVQVSDRRLETERDGWQLAVTQTNQFVGASGQELNGAQLSLTNQALATAQGGNPPSLQGNNPLALTPGVKRTLLQAKEDEGSGTWIYRFGNQETSGSSVALEVPKGANPDATTYTTILNWELSSVPGN